MRVKCVTIQSGRTFQLQLEHLEALSDVAILFLILIMMSATTQVIITICVINTIINHHQSHNTIVITITCDQIASNAATTSMLVPVIKTLAIKLQVTLTWSSFWSIESCDLIQMRNSESCKCYKWKTTRRILCSSFQISMSEYPKSQRQIFLQTTNSKSNISKHQVNPLFFMLPATLVASCAFMLPMSTGGNIFKRYIAFF